ncbi:MAG: tryptophan--tRNA ligase [Buchnera aphidicola (Chaetogeoica yunlongensis)]
MIIKHVKKNVFSAIQPSGSLTIGNYIGVLREWIKIQQDYRCFYCIADLHAITVRRASNLLKKNILDVFAIYLACGINPSKSVVFLQSHVHEHSELHWLLTCYTYYGELSRMIQFKEKSLKYFKNINSGLLNYPILMASDILLYNTDLVPIGRDQKQHMELVCRIARRFNKLYGNIFKIPMSRIVHQGSNILSLSNPTKKMSKSDINVNGVIFLLDDIQSVIKKIKFAVTDSDTPPRIFYDMKNKMGISNLIDIFSGITGKEIVDIEREFYNKSYEFFKSEVARVVADFLIKFQKLYFNFRKNEEYLENLLNEGAKKASIHASVFLKKIKVLIGLF